MKFEVFEYTNKGGRSYNEDNVGSRLTENGGIFVVADGLGGHSRGEVASECVVSTILSGWQQDNGDQSVRINGLFEQANSAVLALQRENHTVMKSTAAVLAIKNNKAILANSGDSRVYYFHNDTIAAYTNDHSVAYKKYKAGEITRDMLGGDEDQSRLLRTLGSEDRYLPDIFSPPNLVTSGDAFLLCSDGAWEYIRDEEMLVDLLKSETTQQWTELMLLRLMERIDGENDNVSIITIKIH